jgi:hypothetical protein
MGKCNLGAGGRVLVSASLSISMKCHHRRGSEKDWKTPSALAEQSNMKLFLPIFAVLYLGCINLCA